MFSRQEQDKIIEIIRRELDGYLGSEGNNLENKIKQVIAREIKTSVDIQAIKSKLNM